MIAISGSSPKLRLKPRMAVVDVGIVGHKSIQLPKYTRCKGYQQKLKVKEFQLK